VQGRRGRNDDKKRADLPVGVGGSRRRWQEGPILKREWEHHVGAINSKTAK